MKNERSNLFLDPNAGFSDLKIWPWVFEIQNKILSDFYPDKII